MVLHQAQLKGYCRKTPLEHKASLKVCHSRLPKARRVHKYSIHHITIIMLHTFQPWEQLDPNKFQDMHFHHPKPAHLLQAATYSSHESRFKFPLNQTIKKHFLQQTYVAFYMTCMSHDPRKHRAYLTKF